jgi:citrate lyase subunit gamma (acyl carrier protein)
VKIVKTGIAGTMESSDVLITVSPGRIDGVEIEIDSVVIKQFGKQIRAVTKETLENLGVTDAFVSLQDKGALDCTIRARLEAAAHRAAGTTQYQWRR